MNADESFCSVKHPMASPIPGVGSDDEESFVVLGNSSFNEEDIEGPLSDEILPPIRSGKVHDMQNIIKMEISQINNSTVLPELPSAADTLNAVTTTMANITLSPDSSYEEIQKQVEELIKENEKLKNIIAQNNLSMKAQYDRILAWKDDVNNVMKSYKDKFVEAKTYIDKCKEENGKLANDVEKYKKIKELQDEEIMNLKGKEKELQTVEPAEQNMAEFELQVSKKKVEELQTVLAETNVKKAELIAENEKLSQQMANAAKTEEDLREAKRLIEDLQSTLFKAHAKYSELVAENENIKQKIAPTTDLALEDVDIANMSQAEQIARIRNLGQQLREKMGQSIDSRILVAQAKFSELLVAENEKLKQKIANTTDPTLEDVDIENMSQAEQIALVTNMARQYREKMGRTIDSRIFVAAEARIKQLEQHNYSLAEEVTSLKYSLSAKEALEEKYGQVREQLTQTQRTVLALEEDNKSKIKEIEDLRQLLQNNSKSDEMYALNEQLALYKNDFEAERESKNALKQERDQIAEDLKNLQKRNKQLQDEIEDLRRRTGQIPNPEGFKCPKCDFAFNNYQALENHVHRCLDLEGFP